MSTRLAVLVGLLSTSAAVAQPENLCGSIAPETSSCTPILIQDGQQEFSIGIREGRLVSFGDLPPERAIAVLMRALNETYWPADYSKAATVGIFVNARRPALKAGPR